MRFAPWLLCQKLWDGLRNTRQHFVSSSKTSLNKQWWNIWHMGCIHSVCLSTCAVLRTENSVFLSDSGFLINMKPARFFYVWWEVEVVCIPGAFELPPEHLCPSWLRRGCVWAPSMLSLLRGEGGGGGQCFLWGQTKSGYKTWSVAYETTLPAPSLQIMLTDVVPVPHLCLHHPCLQPQKWRYRVKPCGVLWGVLNPFLGSWRNIVLFFLFVLNSVKETETKMKHFPLFCEHLEVIRGAIQQAFKIFYVMLN